MSEGRTVHFFTYKVNVKNRWNKRSIMNVLLSEFKTKTKDYFSEALECGVITVNDEIVPPTRKLKIHDVLRCTVHMHEPAPPEIDVIKWEDDYVVVNKPPGIPCHPTTGYLNYSVTRSIFGDRKSACANRLDLPVSGVLIVVFENHKKWSSAISDALKTYVAKVHGMFPDNVTVDKRIKFVEGRIARVCDDGKECLTVFRRIEYKDGCSLVECKPVTGRTHQIRVHLQSIGFPVVNDTRYGKEMGEAPKPMPASGCDTDVSGFEDKKKYECIVKHCEGENSKPFNARGNYICLHSWKYIYNNTEYVAELPMWCKL